MSKPSKVKSRRKYISPVFHLQSKDEDDQHITKDVVKNVRKTGHLNLSSKHLASVPDRMFSIYAQTDESQVDIDFSRGIKEDEAWWNIKTLTNLDLSSNVLTHIPGKIGMFQDLVILNLQDNLLTELPEEIGNLTKLTRLCLNHNKINKLPKDFNKLTELKYLSMSHNYLECVSKSVVDLIMLEKLDMSNNAIQKLPPGIGFLVRLMELNISNNKLTELPPDIVNLRGLLKFDISNNSIRHMPDMGELRKLQWLYAQHNDIEYIPSFRGCEQLQELYLGNNFLKEIPIEFCETMTHLKILELRDNQIEVIPVEITNLFHLSKFDITNNDIKELPNTMGLMPHLQTLKVDGNKLKQIRPDIIQTGTNRIMKYLREKISEEDLQAMNIPSDVSYDCKIFPDRYTMRNGNVLNLAMKDISEIPEECFLEAKEANVTSVDLCKNKFHNVPSGLLLLSDRLTELNLSSNRLCELPDFLSDLTMLKFLDLSKNQLNSLPENFSKMVFLRELVLNNNKFTKIPSCVFDMVGLEILLIKENGVEEISIEGLKLLKRLATLDLSNNNIHVVPPELGNMTQLRCLELKGNPFRQPRYAILEQGTDTILSYLRDKIPI
ncbi:leucine rich repeat containing flyers-cup [Leptinotarsa decemlineata]|uniref:leucine rich repeat containing flyers-cup n=1 Tax=Leptinotarsa decemlineata TaxID=7539 RepID=UPI003D30A3EE